MIIVFGCGQMGSRLCKDLDEQGETVTVIDPERAPLEDLAKHFSGRLVMGLGIDTEVLKRANIEQADSFIAVSRDINTNIMASLVAKLIFKVPRVVTRIEDEELVKLYSSMGLEALSPTSQAAQHIEDLIREKK